MGWKGLINDPRMDASFRIEEGCAWRASGIITPGRLLATDTVRSEAPVAPAEGVCASNTVTLALARG